MIGHEDIGMNGTAKLEGEFLQLVEIAAVVLIGIKAGRAIVATLDEVQWISRHDEAGFAGHRIIR